MRSKLVLVAAFTAVVVVSGLALALVSYPGGSSTVQSDGSPTFGVDIGRSRTISTSTYDVGSVYYPDPNHTPNGFLQAPISAIGSAVHSLSVPAVADSTAYQYAFTPSLSNPLLSDDGYLYAVDLSGTQPTRTWSDSAWEFPATGQNCINNEEPNMATTSAPTIDASGGTMTLAVGCDLLWENSLNGPSGSGRLQNAELPGSGWNIVTVNGRTNAEASYQAINMSALVTPSETENYGGLLGGPKPTTIACAGAWNGGFACAPMNNRAGAPKPIEWVIPSGDCPTVDGSGKYPIHFLWPSSKGTPCQFSLDPSSGYSVITSSPSWDPYINVDNGDSFNGQTGIKGAVVFGINGGGSGPGALVYMDPVTGVSDVLPFTPLTTRVSKISGISSSPVVYEGGTNNPPDGTVVVPDNKGDIFEVLPSLRVGSVYDQGNFSCTTNNNGTDIADISDIAVGKYSVYALEDCLQSLDQFDVGTLTTHTTIMNGLSKAFSPSVVRDPSNSENAFLFYTSSGAAKGFIYDWNIGSSPQSYQKLPLSRSAGNPDFVGPLPDAGPSHYLLLWTNADSGGLQYWKPFLVNNPVSLTANGQTGTITVPVNTTVTFTASTPNDRLGACQDLNLSPQIAQWTCMNLWQTSAGIVASDNPALLGSAQPLTTPDEHTWNTNFTFNTPGTYSYHAAEANDATYWPQTAPSGANSTSNTVTIVVVPNAPPSNTLCTPSSTGWNVPANCDGPTPPIPSPIQVHGAMTLAVASDRATTYSPVYDPTWDPASGVPDPCLSPTSPTCTSPYLVYRSAQYGLFGQHLAIHVTLPPLAPEPPTLSSPPSGASGGICQANFSPSSQDFATLPQGVSETTSQLWPTEWVPLQVENPSLLGGELLVDWSWWPPLKPGTVTGPFGIRSYWTADVSYWQYQQQGNAWVPYCPPPQTVWGMTDPSADGGTLTIWGDRMVLLTPTTSEFQGGLP